MAQSSQNYMKTVENWFTKLPPLPPRAREILVQIAPWFALIFGILGVLASLAAFGFSAVLAPFVAMGGGMHQAGGFILAAVLGLVGSVLTLASFPGLKSRKMQGWTLLFYSEVVGLLGAVISLSVVGVVVSLFWFYVIFQMKPYYK